MEHETLASDSSTLIFNRMPLLSSRVSGDPISGGEIAVCGNGLNARAGRDPTSMRVPGTLKICAEVKLK
jgi:hypothetical protein